MDNKGSRLAKKRISVTDLTMLLYLLHSSLRLSPTLQHKAKAMVQVLYSQRNSILLVYAWLPFCCELLNHIRTSLFIHLPLI